MDEIKIEDIKKIISQYPRASTEKKLRQKTYFEKELLI